MLINESVNSINTLTGSNKSEPGKKGPDNVEKPKTKTQAATLELGHKEVEKVTYKKPDKYLVDRKSVDAMLEESGRKMEGFGNLIRSLITKQ